MVKPYRAAYAAALLRYFDRPPYLERQEGDKPPQRTPNPLPTFAGFARQLRVGSGTLEEWRRTEPAFAAAWEQAAAIQEDIFFTNALLGLYNASFCRVFAAGRFGTAADAEAEDGSLRELSTEALQALLRELPSDG